MFKTKYLWCGIGALTLLLFGMAEQVRGAVIFQTDRLAFETANPGLMIEDFENGNIATDQAFPFPDERLNNATNNAYFSPGDILSGIEFKVSGDSNFAVSNNAFVNTTTKLILAAQASADILINLNPGVTSVGFDIYDFGGTDDNLLVEVLGSSSVLSKFTFNLSALNQQFIGVTSDSKNISSIRLTHLLTGPCCAGAYGIDNVAFGGVVSVPEPFTLGGTVLASAIGLSIKRKQKNSSVM
ncbi:PEP-CTERM sorting domain-containing protein [Nostoc sp. FACHB-133]|uniref:PEP-CTERM sorting domain-containing protein n=1 Tax=Nostoc sp. FACHB-133 TaxID=2692835 RepID=UPI001685816F|nr:PEP-CTERM sorting domain-containing protein [Nostoc sp. FACHB-133]MBD2527272.1 PEP-CTERM sorting domain-containing protein [Nostoc sp. FACHB-133]